MLRLKGVAAFGLATRRPTTPAWALAFLLLTVVAGVFGSGGFSGVSAGIAQILFVVLLALLVLSFVARAFRGRDVT